MQVLVISDIHANFVALDTVLTSLTDYEAVWFLGDLVGYGPQPNECVERLRALPNVTCLVGNHDKAVLGEIDINTFNHDAQTALRWTRRQLAPANLQFLAELAPRAEIGQFTLVHASPRQPVWEYVLDRSIAQENLPYFTTPFCLVGHTHLPAVYVESLNGDDCLDEPPDYAQPRLLQPNRKSILNPGSVGQPRDNNPRASCALLDTDTLTWRYVRVPYDVSLTQQRMREAHLPERLAARLALGW